MIVEELESFGLPQLDEAPLPAEEIVAKAHIEMFIGQGVAGNDLANDELTPHHFQKRRPSSSLVEFDVRVVQLQQGCYLFDLDDKAALARGQAVGGFAICGGLCHGSIPRVLYLIIANANSDSFVHEFASEVVA